MKKFFKMTLLVSCVLMAACTKNAESSKWEYKVMTIEGATLDEGCTGLMWQTQRIADKTIRYFSEEEMRDSLNSVGQQGWELVDIVALVETLHPNFGDKNYATTTQPNTRTQELKLVFKRKVN